MSFISKNPERIQATRKFCEFFDPFMDPVCLVLDSMEDPDCKAAWAIAGAALHQSIGLGQLADLIQSLYAKFPDDRLWSLPAIREKDVEMIFRGKPWLSGWALIPHVPGILNSIGNWIRQEGGIPRECLSGRTTAQVWKGLSQIYFMGKSNPVRPKVLSAIFRLREKAPYGLGYDIFTVKLASGNPWPLPVSVGARKWLKMIGPNPEIWMEKHSELERLQYFQKMYAAICPGAPDKAAHGLSFFLESGGSDLLCRTMQDGCKNCPLGSMSILSGNCPQRRV